MDTKLLGSETRCTLVSAHINVTTSNKMFNMTSEQQNFLKMKKVVYQTNNYTDINPIHAHGKEISKLVYT